jgi:diguanylate cyclase (GGDEF)-like protein
VGSFDDYLKNTTCAEGLFDTALNFYQGNSRINSILGNSVYVSIYKMIPEEEQERLEKAVELCKNDVNYKAEECIHLTGSDGECHTYMIRIRKCTDNEYMDVKLVRISQSEERIQELTERLSVARDLLTLSGNFWIKYIPSTNLFSLLWVNQEEDVVLYQMDLDEWADMVVEKGYLEGDDRVPFEHLCRALKGEPIENRFLFRSKIISKGEALEMNKVKLAKKTYGDEEMVVGIWSIIDMESGQNVDNYVADSYIDPLTKLLNKKAITDYARKTIMEGNDRPIAIAIMDLDNFKSVNDTYGHMFGDKVIIAAAEVIKNSIGDNAVAGRMGGDEFMVVFTDFEDEETLRSKLRCTKTNIRSIYEEKIADIALSCSIGVARYPRDTREFDEMFKIADKCLYIAKQKGKNRYIIYEPEKHGQFFASTDGTDMMDIKDAFYSERDLAEINRLMVKTITDGKSGIHPLFEKVADTLLLDRVSLYWDGKLVECYANSVAEKLQTLDPVILENETYIKNFHDDMAVYNNTLRIEYNIPEVYAQIKKAGIRTLAQYLLRDREGAIRGVLSAEGCEKVFTVPKITIATINNIGGILNAVLIREK